MSIIRTFSFGDQLAFARLSGDSNPIHVDAVAARRLLYGQPVVHGIHILLWALEQAVPAVAASGRLRLKAMSVQFRGPVLVDRPLELMIHHGPDSRVRLELSSQGVRVTTVRVVLEHDNLPASVAGLIFTIPPQSDCRRTDPAALPAARGSLPLYLDLTLARSLFPALVANLPPQQLAALLATTRVVGMEAPGLDSLYLGLELTAVADELPSNELRYAAESFDERFSLLTLQVTAAGISGQVTAAVRPAPQRQAEMAALQRIIRQGEFQGERILIVGGSRGLGEVAVKALAAGGADVHFSYHAGAADAQEIVADIRAAGAEAACFPYDVEHVPCTLCEQLGEWQPTGLGYFATPHIGAGIPGQFSIEEFHAFCECYVNGFVRTLNALNLKTLTGVLYPSSSFVTEQPANMAEYVAAKSAAEAACACIAKAHPAVTFYAPRFGRLATDQTVGLVSSGAPNPTDTIIEAVRRLWHHEK